MARETTYSGNQILGNTPDSVSFDGDGEGNLSNGLGDVSIDIADDGSVTIDVGPKQAEGDNTTFDHNLAEVIDVGALGSLAEEIIAGVQSDITTRQGFIDNYNKGLELLGLKIEEATTTRTQKRNVSRVGHPLLLEAVVRFQAQARAEMLPAIGPCKVMNVGGSTEVQDQLAADLETDVNFFLTQIDKGYYQDFDRGLFALGFGGNLFKKVYHDPLKRFPVSRSIQIEDFIVSDDATSIDDAQRVTHRFFSTNAELKRMQLAKEYVDFDLGFGSMTQDPTKMKQAEILGMAHMGMRAEDQEHEIYETYTDLDLQRYGFREKGVPDGLPVPYIVTVDTTTRKVLSLRRNWRDGDDKFERRKRFVHYGLIPSFGFLCLGFLHLLGNQTRALRAIWRIMIDAGMFSTFPGGMKAKGVRTDNNEIAPGPGEWVDVDIGPFDDIKQGFMPMPYKDLSPNFMQLGELIGADSQRLAGIPEMGVDEGRTHVPVGTMLSLIEQATQTMASVHKRLHSAMQEELTLIKELFAEDPKAITRLARNPARKWETAEEFADLDLVPASDPNIPAQVHRNMQATALVALMQGAPPGLFDAPAIYRRVLKSIGINDWQTVLTQAQPQPPPPDPKIIAKMKELQLKEQDQQFRQQDAQRKAAHDIMSSQQDAARQSHEERLQMLELMLKGEIAQQKEQTARMRFSHEFAQLHAEHAHDMHQIHTEHSHEASMHAQEQATRRFEAEHQPPPQPQSSSPSPSRKGGKKPKKKD